jgi:hypothetical protein
MRCTLGPNQFGTINVGILADLGYVEVFGEPGTAPGLYHVDATQPVLHWPRLGLGALGFRVNGVTLDRAAGTLTATLRRGDDGLTQLTGTCAKQ